MTETSPHPVSKNIVDCSHVEHGMISSNAHVCNDDTQTLYTYCIYEYTFIVY